MQSSTNTPGCMADLIAGYDWAATPLGPIESWPQSLKTIVDLMLGSDVIMAAPWGPEGILLYNDAYARLIGPRGATALGRPVFEALPELREFLGPHLAEARAGKTLRVIDQLYPFVRTTTLEDAWFDISYQPVRGEDGQVFAVLGFIVETTERVLSKHRQEAAEAVLRESEERLALAIDIGGIGHWELDLATSELTTSALCRRNFGRSEQDSFTYDELISSIHPDDRERQQRMVATAINAKSRFEIEYRLIAPSGETRWAEIRGQFEDGGDPRLVGVSLDITERKRAEIALRDGERRLAAELAGSQLLQRLSTRLIPEQPPEILHEQILDAALELMQADAVSIQLLDDDGQRLRRLATRNLHPDSTEYWTWVDASHASTCGQSLRMNRRVVVEDVETNAELAGTGDLDAFRRSGTRAVQSTPLVSRSGRPIGMISTHWREPRPLDESDFGLFDILARQVADLLERSVAETALRESEERFQQFAKASAAGLWIRDADSLVMEYVSPAIADIYGTKADAILGEVENWAAMIVPEDRDIALEHLKQARIGDAAVHEFRIQRPSDHAFRWIRDTVFPLDVNGHVLRIGGIAEDVSEAKLAVQHQGMLLAELQHRVRNIMTIIRSIAARTGRNATSVKDYAESIAGRLLTLARVQVLLTRTANAGIPLATIVQDELNAQAQHEGQFEASGPDIVLSPKAAEVLTLAVHELTTNALKYGGLSVPAGRVAVTWSTIKKRDVPWLVFDWVEAGAPERLRPDKAPSAPTRRGFGSELIEGRIPYELGGLGSVNIGRGGAKCHMEFPLQDGASILETDAPQRLTVFGGSLDMTGEPDLTGHCIMVVEDDYFIASDARSALMSAGAEVIGPCPTEEIAKAELTKRRPDAAVVDVNLGNGPSFVTARALQERGVPFVFTTGYDEGVIPKEFRDVERLEKPVELRRIVSTLAKTLAPPA